MYKKEKLLDRMCMNLGGCVSEDVKGKNNENFTIGFLDPNYFASEYVYIAIKAPLLLYWFLVLDLYK